MALSNRLRNQPVWGMYALLAVAVIAYLVGLIVRQSGQSWPLVDSWGVAAFELTVASLCLVGAMRLRSNRAFAIFLAGALLSWAIGDLLLAVESIGGDAPMPPTLADAFYLGFYPLAYIAIGLLIRSEVTEFLSANWLDGAVAGLGAAALCAGFAFNEIVRALGGTPLSIATNLAYPIGDVLLLGLAAGGTAVLSGYRPRWFLLAGACAVNAVGDTFNLFDSAGKTTHVGLVVDGVAWPVAILLMSLVVWLPGVRTDMQKPGSGPNFMLPAFGALASLGILVVGSMRHVLLVAIALATATLLLVGVRLALSIRTLRVLNDQRRRLANTDHLTGLGNRRQLDQALASFFEGFAHGDTQQRRLAFLFLDLDHFKEINDSFGHAAGDELLRQIGPRLKASLRASDLLVRLGGDELGVLLVETDPDYCKMVAQRLLAAIHAPFLLGDVSVRVSASIGIAIAPNDASDGAGLLRCADVAMYRAKERKTSVELYQQDQQDSGDQLMLVTELGNAVTRKQFVVHYQPQVDLSTGQLVGYEALLRWPHPRLGLVPPLKFLPLAEEAGLMDRVTGLVLQQGLTDAAAWAAVRAGLTLSVNISTTNLLDPGFIDFVQSELRSHELSAPALVLEITETTVLREFERCRRIIAQLHDNGLQVSMDDFGAGFTSLAYLGDLALSEIKLDRAFTAGLPTGARSRDLVRATIDLCHALGMRVVAEGIEDEASFVILRDLGCDVGQGYFIGRPNAAVDLSLRPELAADTDGSSLRVA